MSSRETRRSTSERGSDRQTSVVGSKVSDASTGLWGRRLPRGGIREGEGLKVAEGALGDTGFMSTSREGTPARRVLRIVVIVSGALLGLLVLVGIVLAILSHTAAFSVTSVEAFDSEHLSADVVAQLAAIEPGTTLLNVDAAAIEANVKKNPWVESVTVERAFPDTLRISVHERTLSALVSMGTGGLAWLLASDGAWIEPMRLEVQTGESSSDAALREAEARGVIAIVDVPSTVSPVAGSEATDAVIDAVWTYSELLSPSFASEVVAYSVASEDDISCVMRNGIEVSFGTVANIEAKERVAREIIDNYEGQVTYINVRVPSRPTYRRVDSVYVRPGTGANGTSVDDTPVMRVVSQEEDEQPETGDAGDVSEAGDESVSPTDDGTASSQDKSLAEDGSTSEEHDGGQAGYGDEGYAEEHGDEL